MSLSSQLLGLRCPSTATDRLHESGWGWILVLILLKDSKMALASAFASKVSSSCFLPLRETLQDQQMSPTWPLFK